MAKNDSQGNGHVCKETCLSPFNTQPLFDDAPFVGVYQPLWIAFFLARATRHAATPIAIAFAPALCDLGDVAGHLFASVSFVRVLERKVYQ